MLNRRLEIKNYSPLIKITLKNVSKETRPHWLLCCRSTLAVELSFLNKLPGCSSDRKRIKPEPYVASIHTHIHKNIQTQTYTHLHTHAPTHTNTHLRTHTNTHTQNCLWLTLATQKRRRATWNTCSGATACNVYLFLCLKNFGHCCVSNLKEMFPFYYESIFLIYSEDFSSLLDTYKWIKVKCPRTRTQWQNMVSR